MKKVIFLLALCFTTANAQQSDQTVIKRSSSRLYQIPQRFAHNGVTTLYTTSGYDGDYYDSMPVVTIINDDLEDIREIKLGDYQRVEYQYSSIREQRAITNIVAEETETRVYAEYKPEDYLANDAFAGEKWSWANDGIQVWGSAGNSGNGDGYTATNVDGGMWWGVTDAAELLKQKGHAGGVIYGDESNDAYMVFGDGQVASYAADGSRIRGGSYQIYLYPDGRNNGWELGKLTTSEPALLFPWSINEGGKGVTEYDIMYLDDDYMNLVYTKGNGAGSWGEITYWRFKHTGSIEGDVEATAPTWDEESVLQFLRRDYLTVYSEGQRTFFVESYFSIWIDNERYQTNYPSRYWAIDADGILREYYSNYNAKVERKGEWKNIGIDSGVSSYRETPVDLYYHDLSSLYEGEDFVLTQTLFNNNETYEWLQTRHEVKTISSELDQDGDGEIDYRETVTRAFVTGYDIISEGTVIGTLTLEEGLEAEDEDWVELILINDKIYLGIEAYDVANHKYYDLFYKFDPSSSAIREVKSMRKSIVYPTILSRNEMITIKLDGISNTPVEIETIDAAGRVADKTTLAPGQQTIQMPVRNFGVGTNCINVNRDGKVIGTHKVVVK